MTQESLEGLYQDMRQLGDIFRDIWIEKEALTRILREKGIVDFASRLTELKESQELKDAAREKVQPIMNQLERDAKAAWIEMQSPRSTPPTSGQS